MTSLSAWIKSNIRRPIFIFEICLIAVSTALGYQSYQSYQRNIESAKGEAVDFLSVMIRDKNLPVLEALLANYKIRLNARSAGICKGDRLVTGLGITEKSCSQKGGWGWSRTVAPVKGNSEYRIFFDIPWFFNTRSTQLFLFFILIVSGFLFFLVQLVRHKISIDLLKPLHSGILSDQSFHISELEDLRQSLMEKQRISERLAVKTALEKQTKSLLHDLNGPLSLLKAVLKNPTDLKQRATSLQAVADRINDISNSLEHQRNSQRLQKFDASSAVRELCDETVRLARSRNWNPEVLCRIQDSLYLSGEKVHFCRAIFNILINACEAAPHGKVEVIMEARDQSAAIIISDDGCGIPSNHLNQIWEDGFTHGKENGSGLGLPQAKKVFEREMQGKIEVQSSPGKGTSFEILLPLRS